MRGSGKRGTACQECRSLSGSQFFGGLQGFEDGLRGLLVGQVGLGVREGIAGGLEEVEHESQGHPIAEDKVGRAEVGAAATGRVKASRQVEPVVAVGVEFFPVGGFLKALDHHMDCPGSIDGQVDFRPASLLFEKGPDDVFGMVFLDFFENGFGSLGR